MLTWSLIALSFIDIDLTQLLPRQQHNQRSRTLAGLFFEPVLVYIPMYQHSIIGAIARLYNSLVCLSFVLNWQPARKVWAMEILNCWLYSALGWVMAIT